MKYKWYFIYTFFWKYKRSILYLYFFFLRSTCKVYLISVRDPRWEVTQLLTVQHRLDSGQVIHGRLHIFTAYSLLIEVFYIIFIKNLKPCFMPGNWKKKLVKPFSRIQFGKFLLWKILLILLKRWNLFVST